MKKILLTIISLFMMCSVFCLDVKAEEDDEISVEEGDVVFLVGKKDGYVKVGLNDKFGIFPEFLLKYVMFQVFLAISFLHSNKVVHADIKRENIASLLRMDSKAQACTSKTQEATGQGKPPSICLSYKGHFISLVQQRLRKDHCNR